MKSNKTILILCACIMALLLFATSCGKAVSPKESKQSETEKPEITTSVPTSTPETQPTDEEKTESSDDGEDKVETVDANTWDTAAGLGVWISTKKLGNDSQLGNLRYRVTAFSSDQDAILELIKAYNDEDENYRKVDTEIPANFVFRLCEYEVVYEKDFPGYGEKNSTVYSPDLNFSVAAEGGGGLEAADGLTYIGINCIDISKKVSSMEVGELFKGLVVFAIPDKVVEQYYLSYSYSTKDAEGNYMSVYSYVKPEVISGK